VSVSICTPWTDHLELADDYFDAIRMAGCDVEVVIADNASDPELNVELPAEVYVKPGEFDVLVVRSRNNLGFSGGSNLALRHATGDFVLFLNNDIIAHKEGWLRDLVQAAEPGVLVGASIVNPEHAQVDGVSLPYLDGWCIGGMREDLLELGGGDESLQEPSYYSDNLLCLEARAAGFLLREVHTGLIHKRGQTSQANGFMLPSTAYNRVIYEKRARELLVEA